MSEGQSLSKQTRRTDESIQDRQSASEVPPKVPKCEEQLKSQPYVGWIPNNQTLGILVAFVLLGFYMLPVFLLGMGMYKTTTDGLVFSDPSFFTDWFVAYARSADSTLNEFHKLLFPVISAISIVSIRTRPSLGLLLLALSVLLSFVLSLFLSVVFDMPRTIEALRLLHPDVDEPKIATFFERVMEMQLMYLMMLLGIGVVNSRSADEKVDAKSVVS